MHYHQDTRFATLKKIAEHSAEGVILFNLSDHTILYSNEVAVDLFGLREGATQVEVESLLENIAPEDKAYVINQYSTVDKKAITAEVEFRLTPDNSGRVVVSCTAYFLSVESVIVVFIRNITKEKEYEGYLVEFAARQNTILDVLVHQISGALNLQRRLMVEARKYMVNDNDKNLEIYVKLLGDNNAHCLEIIGDLLTEERERLPTISVKISKIDIVESISLVFDELRGSHRNREFIFDSHSDKIYMYTDVVKMLEVVNNFTSNAIKFSRTEKPIRVSISDYADHVVVCVMDEGIGIPQYLSEHIFQRQNGHGRQGLNGERSLGHGLFICKHLIDLMHGHIWFESVEGKGSTFYFSLPKN